MNLDTLVELENIKSNIDAVFINGKSEKYQVIGSHKFFYYKCDGIDDIGWGCGYRTLQTMCSWIRLKLLENYKIKNITKDVKEVPTILEIQKILVKCEDKPQNFVGSRDWIGCFEASIVIDVLYDIPCKILHSIPGRLSDNLSELKSYFKNVKSPIMMGGDLDNASKGVLGFCENSAEQCYFLIANPHLYTNQPLDKKKVNELVSWIDVNDLKNNYSFYNFCMPQIHLP